MFARLLALFLLIPVVELFLLIQVDKRIGFWPTIGVIVLTGVLGSALARREGISVLRRLQQRLSTGAIPGQEMLDGVIILVAGALLITPGVLTDVVGFLGLLPVSRAIIRAYVTKRFNKNLQQGSISFTGFQPGNAHPPAQEPHWQGTAEDTPRYRDALDDEEGG